jgi:serine/threonine protein kinase
VYDYVRLQLPSDWSVHRQDIWFYCSPCLYQLPLQGWKIHLSATVDNAREVLERVCSRLFRYKDVSFKFAVDYALLSLINSKNWPRGSSGKFITIYPPNNHRFLELIEELDKATTGIQGPYILSDHRYKSSRVVFYRYGGMRTQTVLSVRGEHIPVLTDPNGCVTPDQRFAYPVIPAWETPVLPVERSDGKSSSTLSLMDGRYTVETAIAFSSAGGVYYARDNRTGRKVVVKEARPHINTTNEYDAIELLKKEHRLLTVVADTRIAPQPLDLFQEWEHWFLVEECIDGTVMGRHAAANNMLLRTRPTQRDYDEWCAMFSRLCAELIRIVNILHSRNIVFADLSTNNLIVTASGRDLKLIDFEGAHQLGVDRPTNIYTPGFVSPHRIAGGSARQEDDYYSAGAVLLACLLPINDMLHLNPQARREFVASIRNHIHLPDSIVDLISGLMDQPERRLSAQAGVCETSKPAQLIALNGRVQESPHDYYAVLDNVVTHMNEVAECGRSDRLYPADPRVFATNPLSLAYGAAGVAYALYKLTGKLPEAAIDWMLRHQITSARYPCGLYVGMSGIAWSFVDMGITEPAEKLFQSTFSHPLVYESPDMFYGMAGWGMTGLRLFHATGKEVYLEQAEEAGKRLIASSNKSERGYYWTVSNECPLGLAHGSSGIGLFLLYLYLATENECYLATGSQALDFDLAAAVRTKDGGLSWSESVDSASPLYPYWRFGSAGIGIVTARFQRVLGSPRYQSILEQIFIDTDRKYAVFPGFFTGLAGLGEFLLDMHDLTGEDRFLESANRVAEGVMHFRVERNGTAFPGELLSRLCCDYGTGSAGIGLFLNRLLGRQKSDFMLDGLFENSGQGRRDNGAPRESAAYAAAA